MRAPSGCAARRTAAIHAEQFTLLLSGRFFHPSKTGLIAGKLFRTNVVIVDVWRAGESSPSLRLLDLAAGVGIDIETAAAGTGAGEHESKNDESDQADEEGLHG
ncbi:MAG: hypothetical protein ABSB86_03185 [Bryobacteraceae bacterium]|jgi:hypothetical protein